VAEMVRSPLAGKRVVITRPALHSETLVNALTERGATAIVRPLIAFSDPEDFQPLDKAISEVGQFDWLMFTSGEAVRSVTRRSNKLGPRLGQQWGDLRVAAVGPGTAETITNAGLQVDYVAEEHSGIGLANELGERLRGKKVLLPRSDRANPDLPRELRRHKAEVTEVIAYRTLKATELELEELTGLLNGKAEAILFFSPSAVEHFVEMIGGEQLRALEDKVAITAVGPVSANALQDAGVRHIVQARDTTVAAVVEALEEYFGETARQAQTGAKKA
jgi:uroporphyrinogen-III synthase